MVLDRWVDALAVDGTALATIQVANHEVGTLQPYAAAIAAGQQAGVPVVQVPDPGTHPWLSAMFAYYDAHGLPAGTRVLGALLVP